VKARVASAVVVALVVLGFASAAGAKSNSPATAQSAANGFIQALLPSSPGQPGICDTKTQSGFFAKRASYLASCSTTDGGFAAFSIFAAKNGSLHVNSPYVGSQLKTFCAGGHAYSTGVKGKFADLYAGTGDGPGTGAAVAQDLAKALGDQIKNVPGHVAPFKVC
jgi:hypothetical protein